MQLPWAHHRHTSTSLHVLIFAVPTGILVGLGIAAYDYLVNAVLWSPLAAHLDPFTLCWMPLVGMTLTGVIVNYFRITSTSMADDVVKAYHDADQDFINSQSGPKLLASVTTMGFGCSAGMEGASKWLGASIAGFLQSKLNRLHKFKIAHGPVDIALITGAAAGIGAILRAPLSGAIMGLESPYKNDFAHEAILHGFVASAVSYTVYAFIRTADPYFPIAFHYVFNSRDLMMCVPVGVAAGLGSHVFLWVLRRLRQAKSTSKWPPLAIYVAAGAILSLIALAVTHETGTGATLQSGLPVANQLLAGKFDSNRAMIILIGKILATAITFGLGGVGGLFVPSATIGAAIGALCDLFLTPSQPGLFTLIGIAAFTGASYSSLLFAVVFLAEASGNPSLMAPALIATCVAYLVAGGVSNSPSQHKNRSHRRLH